MTTHDFRAGEDDDGWDIPTCGCGWQGDAAPDIETAADMWGDHLVTVAVDQWKDAQKLLVDSLDLSHETYDTLAQGLIRKLYPDEVDIDGLLYSHASGPADLLPLLEDTGRRELTLDGFERAVLLGPPYKSGAL